MSLRKTIGRWLILLLPTALIGVGAQAQEERCLELGSNCVCSEPMNVNDGQILHGHNWSDSPASSDCYSAEDASSAAAWGTSFPDHFSVPETGMPPQNTVDWVVESNYDNPSGQVLWQPLRGKPAPTDQRVCMRQYFEVSRDWMGAQNENGAGCPVERNKMIQISYGSGPTFQMQEIGTACSGPPGSGLAPYHPFSISMNQGGLGNPPLSPPVDWSDCAEGTGWCRVEACIYGDLQGGRNLYIDVRLTPLNTGITSEATTGPVSPGSGLDFMAWDLYHGQGAGPYTGKRKLSHTMQAAWPTNNGQWIGAAYEIEGGAGSSPPPPGGGGSNPPPQPPPAQPPAPPLLLQPTSSAPGGGTTSAGSQTLTVTTTVSGSSVQVASTVTNGQGAYNFLTDCGGDGNWNGVDQTSSPVSIFTCNFTSSGTQNINVQMWDEGTSVSLSVPFQVTTN